jgi:predicted enzyme related to lactoylglutathione lyase
MRFWVSDCGHHRRQGTIRGGTVLAPPYDVPGFREAILADSQGAVFTVSQLTGFR